MIQFQFLPKKLLKPISNTRISTTDKRLQGNKRYPEGLPVGMVLGIKKY
jgi:hypothetical protein